jgi:DNA polymerase III delta prime subunit
MNDQAHGDKEPGEILRRSIENGRVHSAYLLTGTGEEPRERALAFARALACQEGTGVACEACEGCHRSSQGDEVVIDGKGKRGPTYRHIGDHPDLLWVERGSEDTRVTIGQVRDVQAALRLGANEGGRRCAVIADAEWLNPQAQNALLRLLEEPPPATTLVLVASRASAIIATIRSRSVRVRFPIQNPGIRAEDAPESVSEIVSMLDGLSQLSMGELLDLAETYRGARAVAAEHVTELVDVASEWLNEDAKNRVARGETPAVRELDAYHSLQQLRRDLVQRNANPQMVAERLLLGLRDVVAG